MVRVAASGYNTIKDPQWYAVQGIRRGGNDDDHSFLARTTQLITAIFKYSCSGAIEILKKTAIITSNPKCLVNFAVQKISIWLEYVKLPVSGQ